MNFFSIAKIKEKMGFHGGMMADKVLKEAVVAGLVFVVATQMVLPRYAVGQNKVLVGTAIFIGMMYATHVLLGEKFLEHMKAKAGKLKHCVLMPNGETKCFDDDE